jgi:UDP-N-acetylglucosamine:LPS N-acetylglucosamine transferase
MHRVLAISSGGGHWIQLWRMRPAWDDCEVCYVTTDPSQLEIIQNDARNRKLSEPVFYSIVEANRWQKLRLLYLLVQVAWILFKFRPTNVVTTGAAAGYFAIRLGKLLGARTVWIDSLANVDRLSLSGERVGRYADVWLTQWPNLERPDGPTYKGSVL